MKKRLDHMRRRGGVQKSLPIEESERTLSLKRSLEIARRKRIPLRTVEIKALRKQIIPERYSKNIRAIGIDGQIKLLESQIAIVGVGGLGGAALEFAARLGIGKIIIIDGDRFTESNMNRQLLSHCKNIGKLKAHEARKRIRLVNPAIEVGAISVAANKKNLIGIIGESHVVIDGLDNIRTRIILEKACKELRIPLIHAAVAGFAGQVTTIFPEDSGLKRIYGTRSVPERDNKNDLGIICVTPALAAAIQVSEAIKVLLGWPKTLRERVLFFDLKELFIGIIESM